MVKLRKQSTWLVVAAFVTIVAISFAFFIDKVTVMASDSALSAQGWQANFSTPLKESAVDANALYVTNSSGKRVNAEITLSNNRRTVHVDGLAPGSYTLHVMKDAVNGKLFKSLPVNEIKFTVHETIESVASAKELKAYFERAKSMSQMDGAVTNESA